MKQKIIGNKKDGTILEKNEKRSEVKWSGQNANSRMVPICHILIPIFVQLILFHINSS